jgi:hypothetical protein
MCRVLVGRRGWRLLLIISALLALSAPSAWAATAPRAFGELDCNGFSTIQQSVRTSMACTDIRGDNRLSTANLDDGRFYDNGHYIGHDEPDMTFLSDAPGSGKNVTWNETLPLDPTAPPTVKTPGADVSHWFELSRAPWFSMAMCDPNSYPQLPCNPQSDKNASQCELFCRPGQYPGAGGAFMEAQFYAPGFAPFPLAISCDNAHWCGALTIDSEECTLNFASCNPQCIEPANFAYFQTDGLPAGPPSPQLADISTFTPNARTLLMNPGDRLRIHMWDAPTPDGSGAKAFEVKVTDLTTGQTGFMQASAANGFMNTSIVDCSGTPFNFEPEYNTAKKANITPWAALQTNISTQFETGHFEPCTSLGQPFTLPLPGGATDADWNKCKGPYEATAPADGGKNPEVGDANCFPKGDTHGSLNTAPDTITGCIDNLFQNGDLDFDGTPYWAEWPTGTAPTSLFPGSFVQSLPRTGSGQYKQLFIQTDLALSESTCDGATGAGCAVPPPNAPGNFYPYWSRVKSGGSCTLEFGNVSSGPGVNDFGKDAQYGRNRLAQLGYPEFEGPLMNNACAT